jgi:hypothetical protein
MPACGAPAVTVAVVDGSDVTTPVVVVAVAVVVVAVVVLAVGALLVDDAVGGVNVCGVLVVVVAAVVVAVVVVVVVVLVVVVVVVQLHLADVPVHRPTHSPTMQFSPDGLNRATQMPFASHAGSFSQASVMRAGKVQGVPERTTRSTQRPPPHT